MIYQLVEEAKLWLEAQHIAKAAGTLVLSTADPATKEQPPASQPSRTTPPPSTNKHTVAVPKEQPSTTPPLGTVGKHTVVMQGEEDDLEPEAVQELIGISTARAAGIAQEQGPFVMADQGAWKYTVGTKKVFACLQWLHSKRHLMFAFRARRQALSGQEHLLQCNSRP